jgi:hypothetical protein
VRDIDADLNVAQEATPAPKRLAIERISQALDLLVVWCHPASQQPPRSWEPLKQVNLYITTGSKQAGGGKRARRASANDRHSR